MDYFRLNCAFLNLSAVTLLRLKTGILRRALKNVQLNLNVKMAKDTQSIQKEKSILFLFLITSLLFF